MEPSRHTEKRIIYNVTSKIDHAVANDWLRWLQEVHIPGMMSTGCFTHTVLLQLVEVDDSDGPTYAVQYHCANKEHYRSYINLHAPGMRKQTNDKWGDQVISFRSVLEEVN